MLMMCNGCGFRLDVAFLELKTAKEVPCKNCKKKDWKAAPVKVRTHNFTKDDLTWLKTVMIAPPVSDADDQC
jgi:hypothetical protein